MLPTETNPPNTPPTDMIRIHFDHYLKLLDLYETRQTNSFNYALFVYGFGVSAAGFIFDKGHLLALCAPVATADSYLTIGTLLTIYSITIPLILLPLFYLYVDVSMYCAALTAGKRTFHQKSGNLGLETTDPGIEAGAWLKGIEEDVSPYAKRRIVLFIWAPMLGCLVGTYSLTFATRNCHSTLIWFSILALLVSATALILTLSAVRRNNHVRNESAKLGLEESERLSQLSATVAGTTRPLVSSK